jgi:hypothetical protein
MLGLYLYSTQYGVQKVSALHVLPVYNRLKSVSGWLSQRANHGSGTGARLGLAWNEAESGGRGT